MKSVKKIVLSFLPVCFFVMLMLSLNNLAICILTILSAMLHEIGHIFAFIIIKRGAPSFPKAVLNGLKLYTGADLSYSEELIITLAGPLMNIVVFLFTLPFFSLSGYIFTFGIINLFSCISNLIPIKSYDGYGILRAFVFLRFSLPRSEILELISLISASLITLISAVAIFIIGEGYWLFIVFFIHLLKEILKSH